jgi:AcrR family transcriptional regulator
VVTATRTNSTSDRRRDQVLDAATHEFAIHGYHAASTASIAKLAGISQPYIYALFPNKRELFLATYSRMIDDLRATFFEAARGLEDPGERLHAMGMTYLPLIEGNRDHLLLQMQGHATAGDPEVGPAIAAHFKSLFEDVRRVSGASAEAVTQFFACGMLLNVTTALDLPEITGAALGWAHEER